MLDRTAIVLILKNCCSQAAGSVFTHEKSVVVFDLSQVLSGFMKVF